MPQKPVAIITGAGSGIGQAASELLAGAGYRLSLVGRDQIKLRATAGRIAQQTPDGETRIIPADVSQSGAARSIVAQTLDQWGRIDALINNAALLLASPIAQTDEHALQATFAANTFGPALLTACIWPVFVKQRSGCIINISSMATLDPFPDLGIYAASKAALESLTRSAAKEGRDYGIRAFSVAPGAVETAMLRRVVPKTTLNTDRTLNSLDVARVIVECIRGERDSSIGQTIILPSP